MKFSSGSLNRSAAISKTACSSGCSTCSSPSISDTTQSGGTSNKLPKKKLKKKSTLEVFLGEEDGNV